MSDKRDRLDELERELYPAPRSMSLHIRALNPGVPSIEEQLMQQERAADYQLSADQRGRILAQDLSPEARYSSATYIFDDASNEPAVVIRTRRPARQMTITRGTT